MVFRSTGRFKLAPWTLSLALATGLAACGGGGGGDGGASDGGTTPATGSLSFSGTVASGQALAGAAVRLQCATGSGSTTAGANGSYSLTLASAALPCMARATSADGATVLHALADPNGGATQVLNISTLTELVAARTLGTETAPAFTAFGAATAGSVTTGALASAIAYVVASLKDAAVDFSAIGNPMTAALTARTTTSAGNAYDQLLDALGARLSAAGSSLAALSTAMAQTRASTAVALPPAQLLSPAHADCAALRSGTYRWIQPNATDGSRRVTTAVVDVAARTVSVGDGTLAITSVSGCRFNGSGPTTAAFVVTAAGFITGDVIDNGKSAWFMAFPAQSVTAADMQGSWNSLEYALDPAVGLRYARAGVTTVDGTGTFTAASECSTAQGACVAQSGPFPQLRAHASDGGLEILNPDGSVASERIHTYRAANGDRMGVMVGAEVVGFITPRRTLAVPAAGSTLRTWDIAINPFMVANDSFDGISYSITATDPAAGTYSRQRTSDGLTQTFRVNSPREGMLYRPAGSSPLNSGATVSFTDFALLPIPGLGIQVFAHFTTANERASGSFGITVAQN